MHSACSLLNSCSEVPLISGREEDIVVHSNIRVEIGEFFKLVCVMYLFEIHEIMLREYLFTKSVSETSS